MSDAMLIWGLALIAAGVLLIVIEAFVPSGGLIAVAAGGSAIAGVVCLFMVSMGWGISGLLAVLILGPMSFAFAMSMLPSTPIGRALLGGETEETQMERQLAEKRASDERAALIGAEGLALTDLRPVGTIEIDGRRYEALADSSLIDHGTRVRVTGASMLEIKVRPIG